MNARFRTAAICAAGLLVLAAAFPRAQSASQRVAMASTGTAQLGGVVTSADAARQPVRRVLVQIRAPELRGPREAVTDDLGRFLFMELPAGRYTLTATKPGYLDTSYGATRWRGAGTPVSLAEGQQELGIRLPLPKGGIIAGIVRDPAGVGTGGALVQVLERTTVNGQASMVLAGRSGVTDDRGAYRIIGVPPGTYFVAVSNGFQQANAVRLTTAAELQWAAQPPPGANQAAPASAPPASQPVAFTPVLFPGVTDASAATPIALDAGGERLDVDIQLRLVPIARVTGIVSRADGQPAYSARLSLTPDSPARRELSVVTRAPNATLTPRGEFTFASVEPGRYVLTAQASSSVPNPNLNPTSDVVGPIPGPMDLWARTIVDVNGQDVTGVSVLLQAALAISGRLTMEHTTSPPVPNPPLIDVQAMSLTPTGAAMVPLRASAREGEAFTIHGLAPGAYLISIRILPPPGGQLAPPNWVVKAVQMQGRDAFDRFVDLSPGGSLDLAITLTDKVASLSGKLMDGQGKPSPNHAVVLIPVDRAYWVQGMSRAPRSTRPASDGAYRFDAMPPGEYYVAAATDIDARELFNAAYLEQFIPGAVKLTIAEGEKKVQDLKIGGSGLISTGWAPTLWKSGPTPPVQNAISTDTPVVARRTP